ncbi:unnamed protein product, partial [Dibothriocephalus latus]
VSEHQPQESVAVQTSPLEDVSGGATSSEAYNSETGRRQSAIKLKDVVAPIFRKNYKRDTVQTPVNAHEERHDSEKKKVQHPSEGVLKKLLRRIRRQGALGDGISALALERIRRVLIFLFLLQYGTTVYFGKLVVNIAYEKWQ